MARRQLVRTGISGFTKDKKQRAIAALSFHRRKNKREIDGKGNQLWMMSINLNIIFIGGLLPFA